MTARPDHDESTVHGHESTLVYLCLALQIGNKIIHNLIIKRKRFNHL